MKFLYNFFNKNDEYFLNSIQEILLKNKPTITKNANSYQFNFNNIEYILEKEDIFVTTNIWNIFIIKKSKQIRKINYTDVNDIIEPLLSTCNIIPSNDEYMVTGMVGKTIKNVYINRSTDDYIVIIFTDGDKVCMKSNTDVYSTINIEYSPSEGKLITGEIDNEIINELRKK